MRRLFIVALAATLVGSAVGTALAEDEGTEGDGTESTVLSEAQMWKARMIADYFIPEPTDEDASEAETGDDPLVDEIVEARTGEPAIGWGALYKVMQLWVATGGEDQTLTDFIGMLEEDGGWAFGQRFKALDDDQRTKLEEADLPRNLGQAQKQAKAEERALKKANDKKNNDD
ncbi:MAG TPA: hypothetical protein VLA29_00640 [Acidimicrobiia bacterium]|nr:hypothetical protein [Acidimicrobiia bacterium]